MFMLKIVLISCFFISMITQSAASITSQAAEFPDILDSMIGIACNKNGAYALHKSFSSDNEPHCSFTIAYGEHAALKENKAEKLELIAATIANSEARHDTPSLYRLAKELRKKYAPNPKDSELMAFNKIREYDLIAVYIKFNSTHMSFCECTLHPMGFSGWSTDIYKEKATHFKGRNLKSYELLTNPQADAEHAQQADPESTFNAILDFEPWRQFVLTYHNSLENNLEKTAKSSSEKSHCSLQ